MDGEPPEVLKRTDRPPTVAGLVERYAKIYPPSLD